MATLFLPTCVPPKNSLRSRQRVLCSLASPFGPAFCTCGTAGLREHPCNKKNAKGGVEIVHSAAWKTKTLLFFTSSHDVHCDDITHSAESHFSPQYGLARVDIRGNRHLLRRQKPRGSAQCGCPVYLSNGDTGFHDDTDTDTCPCCD